MGHRSIQVTVDICGQLVHGGNRAAVDRLDDEQPVGAPAQPEAVAANQPRRDNRSGSVVSRIFASRNQMAA
jgi:hypothetical protein